MSGVWDKLSLWKVYESPWLNATGDFICLIPSVTTMYVSLRISAALGARHVR